jgi:hypothetical protein
LAHFGLLESSPRVPFQAGKGILRPGAGRVGTTVGRGAGEGFPWRLAWSILRGKPDSLRAMVGIMGVGGPSQWVEERGTRHWKGEALRGELVWRRGEKKTKKPPEQVRGGGGSLASSPVPGSPSRQGRGH